MANQQSSQAEKDRLEKERLEKAKTSQGGQKDKAGIADKRQDRR